MSFLKDPQFKAPPDEARRRNEQFNSLNGFVDRRGGWLTSSPGEIEAILETLSESDLPDLFRGGLKIDGKVIGRDIAEIKGAERILTLPSTESGAPRVAHAGIVKTRRWSFRLS